MSSRHTFPKRRMNNPRKYAFFTVVRQSYGLKASKKGIACKPRYFEELVVWKLIKKFIVG